jgi:site-specific DNA-cytosine methylase
MEDSTKLSELALFAGAGGGIFGSILLGHRIVGAVEVNPYAREVLLRRQNVSYVERHFSRRGQKDRRYVLRNVFQKVAGSTQKNGGMDERRQKHVPFVAKNSVSKGRETRRVLVLVETG